MFQLLDPGHQKIEEHANVVRNIAHLMKAIRTRQESESKFYHFINVRVSLLSFSISDPPLQEQINFEAVMFACMDTSF